MNEQACFKVLKAGFQASIQDAGRFGYQQFGLATSGALDSVSYDWANKLLGNPSNAAVLEIPYGHVSLEANAATCIVITGANLGATCNGEPILRYQPLPIQAGDKIDFHQAQTLDGVRAYLGVDGGFQTEVFWQSRSVNFREGIGRAIVVDDCLPFHPTTEEKDAPYFPQSELTEYLEFGHVITLRLLPAHQFYEFDEAQRQAFFKQTFTASNEFDRTACRLIAEQEITPPYTQMVSQGMTPGTVQIPPSGHPIIMLKDHPTIGGYPKIGTVIAKDLAKLAQSQPRQKIQFRISYKF